MTSLSQADLHAKQYTWRLCRQQANDKVVQYHHNLVSNKLNPIINTDAYILGILGIGL